MPHSPHPPRSQLQRRRHPRSLHPHLRRHADRRLGPGRRGSIPSDQPADLVARSRQRRRRATRSAPTARAPTATARRCRSSPAPLALITGPLTAAPFRVLEQGYGGQPLAAPRWVIDPMLLRPDARFVSDVYPDVRRAAAVDCSGPSGSATPSTGATGAFLTQLDESGQPLAGTLRNIDSALLSHRARRGRVRCAGCSARTTRTPRRRSSTGTATCPRLGHLPDRGAAQPAQPGRRGRPLAWASSSSTRPPSGSATQIDTYASGHLPVRDPGRLPQGRPDDELDDPGAGRRAQGRGGWPATAATAAASRCSTRSPSSCRSTCPRWTPPSVRSKRLNIADVAYAFGLDPETLGRVAAATARRTTTSATRGPNHRDFGLAPWIAAVEDTLTALLPGPQARQGRPGRLRQPARQRAVRGLRRRHRRRDPDRRRRCRAIEGLPELPRPSRPPISPCALPAGGRAEGLPRRRQRRDLGAGGPADDQRRRGQPRRERGAGRRVGAEPPSPDRHPVADGPAALQ